METAAEPNKQSKVLALLEKLQVGSLVCGDRVTLATASTQGSQPCWCFVARDIRQMSDDALPSTSAEFQISPAWMDAKGTLPDVVSLFVQFA
jgi:hypothetical protein